MILLGWNYQELENPHTIHDLCLLIQEKIPNVIFLIEIKIDSNKTKVIRRRLGLCGCFVVNAIDRKGDLAILWKKEGQIEF